MYGLHLYIGLKQEGESCGSCFCPPTYTAGNCAPGLQCQKDPRISDAAGKCVRAGQIAIQAISKYKVSNNFKHGFVVKPNHLFQFNFIYLKGPNQTIKINLDYTRWKVHLHCIREDHTGLRGLNHRRKPTFSIGNNLKRLGIYLIPQGHAQVILRFGIILDTIYIFPIETDMINYFLTKIKRNYVHGKQCQWSMSV